MMARISPKTPPKPSDFESQMLVEHFTSANKCKREMIDKHFKNEIFQAYFIDELLAMDTELVILTYMDPSMLILGPMMDFGTPHPDDKRNEETRKIERQDNKDKALERFLMLARFVFFLNYFFVWYETPYAIFLLSAH